MHKYFREPNINRCCVDNKQRKKKKLGTLEERGRKLIENERRARKRSLIVNASQIYLTVSFAAVL